MAGNAPAVAPTSSAPPANPQAVVRAVLNQYEPVIRKLLAGTTTQPETLIAWIGNACRANPVLWECDPATLLGAALRCAQVNLAPNDGRNLCSIIPYKQVATWQLGYGGILELARRAMPGTDFTGHAVYPGDEFDIELGRERPLVYRPAVVRRAKNGARIPRGGDAYAWFVRVRFPDGVERVHWLDRQGVEYHRSFSRQPDGPAWSKSYDAMALKSVVKDMARWLPASPVLAAAVAADGVVVDVRELDESDPALPAGGPVEPDELDDDERWVAEASSGP